MSQTEHRAASETLALFNRLEEMREHEAYWQVRGWTIEVRMEFNASRIAETPGLGYEAGGSHYEGRVGVDFKSNSVTGEWLIVDSEDRGALDIPRDWPHGDIETIVIRAEAFGGAERLVETFEVGEDG